MSGSGEAPRWPTVVSTVGIVLAALMFLDKLDDLLLLGWTEDDWARVLGAELAALVVRALPPAAWRLVSALIQLALALLLFSGSLALRRHHRAGVGRCRLWAWLAIVWSVSAMGVGLLWVQRYVGGVPDVSAVYWYGSATFGIIVALSILLAFPVFLLYWLSRADVRAEYGSWVE
jgi:hypothetical protein